jgi:hypothetical protein
MDYGESVHQTSSVAKEDDRTIDDRIDEMIDAILLKLETNLEDPPTPRFKSFLISLEL